MRNPRQLVPALAAVLALLLTGCSGDDEPSDADASPTDASATTSSAGGRFAVTLEVLEQPTPSGGPTNPPPSDAASAQALPVQVTNAGKQRDDYLLRVIPPQLGTVDPPTLRMGPGDKTVVQVLLRPSESAETPVLTVVSRATGDVVATLELGD